MKNALAVSTVLFSNFKVKTLPSSPVIWLYGTAKSGRSKFIDTLISEIGEHRCRRIYPTSSFNFAIGSAEIVIFDEFVPESRRRAAMKQSKGQLPVVSWLKEQGIPVIFCSQKPCLNSIYQDIVNAEFKMSEINSQTKEAIE